MADSDISIEFDLCSIGEKTVILEEISQDLKEAASEI